MKLDTVWLDNVGLDTVGEERVVSSGVVRVPADRQSVLCCPAAFLIAPSAPRPPQPDHWLESTHSSAR